MEVTQMVKKEIQHFLHPHSLFLIPLEEHKGFDCNVCRNKLSYPSYGCFICDFYLHESCSQIPQDLQHYLHPCSLTLSYKSWGSRCNACFEYGFAIVFRCEDCNFGLDMDCALKQPTIVESEAGTQIQHYIHQHPLQLIHPNEEGDEVFCSICRKLCLDVVCGCNICEEGFFVHQSCMNIPRRTDQHPFHPQHSLTLLPKHDYKCKACGKKCIRCLAYSCGQCGVDLDVECALLPTVECERAQRIQHIYHEHPLVHLASHQMKEDRFTKIPPNCSACEENSPTPDFGCLRCKFFLHRSCAVDPFPQILHDHPFHPNHRLNIEFAKEGTFWCCVCCSSGSKSLKYSCLDCSGMNSEMHLSCSKMKPSINCGNHKHLFTLIENIGDSVYHCIFCDEFCKTFFLNCVPCNIYLHIQCHPSAPKTVKHKYHRYHDLVLTPSPLDYDLEEHGKLNEYYCDFCELPRPASNPVYCCKKCNISTCVRCVISQVLSSINEAGESSTSIDRENTDPELMKLVQSIQVLKADFETMESEIMELNAQVDDLKSQLKVRETKLKEKSENCGRLLTRMEYLETSYIQRFSKTKRRRSNSI